MSSTLKGILLSVGGIAGSVIVVLLVRLVIDLLGLIIPIGLVYVLLVVGLVTVGAIVWYRKYRRDQKWIRENQDLITGRRSR